MKLFLHFLIISSLFSNSFGVCSDSYIVTCDSIEDFNSYKDVAWTEVTIKNKNKKNQMKNFNMLDFLRLRSLTIVESINNIFPKSHRNYCLTDNKLEILNLFNNEIKFLQQDAFGLYCKLKDLKLINNGIETIEALTFTTCQPESINLSNNKLEVIPSYAFGDESTPNKTTMINLQRNQITYIEKNAFPSTLQVLNLNENNLRFLQPKALENLSELKLLLLKKNKLLKVPKITSKNLAVLDLSYNDIEDIYEQPFVNLKNLKVLNLSHNKLILLDVETFRHQKAIMSIDLSYNTLTQASFIKCIYENALSTVRISLAFNRFKDLTFDFNRNLSYYTSLELSLLGNPWSCKSWISLVKRIKEYKFWQNDCEIKHIVEGKSPFCIGSEANPSYVPLKQDGLEDEQADEDVKSYQQVAEKMFKKLNCDILSTIDYTTFLSFFAC